MPRTSNHVLILEAVQATIVALALSGIDTSLVKVLKSAKVKDVKFPVLPAIIVAPYGSETVNTDPDMRPTNVSDVIGYPVLVGIVQKDTTNQDDIDALDTVLTWRKQLRQKLSCLTQLSGLSLNHYVRMEQSNVVMDEALSGGNILSPLLLRVPVEETHG